MQDQFKNLTTLQNKIGYVKGDINTIALLGLFGEAGEVLNEVTLITDNKQAEKLRELAVRTAELIDDFKKVVRQTQTHVPVGTHIIAEDNGKRLDVEMADLLYYLNALAINRGKKLSDYAQMSIEKSCKKTDIPVSEITGTDFNININLCITPGLTQDVSDNGRTVTVTIIGQNGNKHMFKNEKTFVKDGNTELMGIIFNHCDEIIEKELEAIHPQFGS